LAVASLVLSLVWLGGLGSLLAVIFGARARGQIRRSPETQSGSGLATAGLVIGILGLIGAVITWAAVFTVGNEVKKTVTPANKTARVGQAIDVEQAGGLASIAVVRVEHPVPGRSQFESAGAGKEFAVAEIKLCAGSAGSHEGITMLFLSLVFPDGTTEGPSLFNAREPRVSQFDALGPNQCGQGFATFAIRSGTNPSAVRYRTSPFRTYEWTL
jgi:hypothetical protein